MFIIVENNSVLLGPMPWRPTAFKNCLQDDCDVFFDVPLSNDNNSVIVINESIKIMPVVDLESSTAFNPKIEFLNGPFYNFLDDYAEMYWNPTPKDINLVKSELKDTVAHNRWRYEIAGVSATIQNQNIRLYTSREDRSLYLQAYQLGVDNVNWKFENNVFLTLSNSDLGLIVQTVTSHVQSVFDWEADVNNSINSAETLEEVNNIKLISSQWETTVSARAQDDIDLL